MTIDILTNPDLSRLSAIARFEAMLPKLGKSYAANRNFDRGSGLHNAVTTLSPWVRHRVVLEQEIVNGVLAAHGFLKAEKFIQEVFWRTYWKGWLEMRPSVWTEYLSERDQALEDMAKNKDLSNALAGETGIDCFDYWVRELKETNYLHNHARMWFASIWIFTLKLPWTIGADLFMRFLLDGDPASNTLSWRWVAGLQTQGKNYLARADNIKKYTEGRFDPINKLATFADPIGLSVHPDPIRLEFSEVVDPGIASLLLVHDEDLGLDSLGILAEDVVGVAIIPSTDGRAAGGVSESVSRFVAKGLKDAVNNFLSNSNVPKYVGTDPGLIKALYSQTRAQRLVTAYAPIGPTRALLDQLEVAIGDPIQRVTRPWDQECWPHAEKGFFGFKKKIPSLIQALCS